MPPQPVAVAGRGEEVLAGQSRLRGAGAPAWARVRARRNGGVVAGVEPVGHPGDFGPL